MGCWLGWLTAALLLGYILGTSWNKPDSLRNRCAGIISFRGKGVAEVMLLLDAPAQEVQTLPDGTILRTWRQHGYAITLAFDARDVCQGVYDEGG